MRIIDCVQGTPEWLSARCGIPSASNFDKIVTSKGEPSKQRQKYLFQLAGESITGVAEESFKSSAMERGTLLEEEARDFYRLITNEKVDNVGFCIVDGEYKYGASPDGLVRDVGGTEIKCPMLSTQVGYLLDNKLPTEYFQQVQGNLLVTGREWWDFISYYPGIKPLIIRVQRDEQFLKLLEKELISFCQELNDVIKRLS